MQTIIPEILNSKNVFLPSFIGERANFYRYYFFMARILDDKLIQRK